MFSAKSILIAMAVVCGLLFFSAPPARAADGKVQGMVTINGKPLAAGKIFFHLENGQFVGAKVTNGRYTVDRVPVGKRKVTVEGAGVPAKFKDEDNTPLVVTVRKGSGTHDIGLSP